MSKNTVKFYMQKYPAGGVEQVIKDLESDFDGLLVSKVDGINNIGKNKNIYTEKYPEQDGTSVWIGTPYYESTDITFTFYFVGDNRFSVYDAFCNYVKRDMIYYWDTYYKKKVSLLLAEPIEIGNIENNGNNPNIEVSIKFMNTSGTYTKIQ